MVTLPPPLFPAHRDVVVPTTLLNNLWRIIGQPTKITANQHFDLQHLMSLLKDAAVDVEGSRVGTEDES